MHELEVTQLVQLGGHTHVLARERETGEMFEITRDDERVLTALVELAEMMGWDYE